LEANLDSGQIKLMVPRAKLVCVFKAKMLGSLSAFLKEIMAEKEQGDFLFVVNCSF